jgi:PPOX class probable F420-dependent enzyme
MSRRDAIRMTEPEVRAFLRGTHTMNVASHGPDGRIHLVAMWYGFVGEDVAMWTFPKSQKVKNLRRDARFTALVEEGEDYSSLKGVELAGTAEIVEDYAWIRAAADSLSERHMGGGGDAIAALLDDQARKRVGIKLAVDHVASWDHTKLAGGY